MFHEKKPRRAFAPRGCLDAGFFFGFAASGPGLLDNESFAPDVERYQSVEIHHTATDDTHIEHGQKQSRFGIIRERSPRKSLFDASATSHLAHGPVATLSEVAREDSTLGFVPEKFGGTTKGNGMDVSFDGEHLVSLVECEGKVSTRTVYTILADPGRNF